MNWEADIEITEKEPDHIDSEADAVYKVEGLMEPFYLLLPSKECIGVRDHLRDMRLPLKNWLMEWDGYSPEIIDQLHDEIPRLDEDDPENQDEPEGGMSL